MLLAEIVNFHWRLLSLTKRLLFSADPEKIWHIGPLGLFDEGSVVHLDWYFTKPVQGYSTIPAGRTHLCFIDLCHTRDCRRSVCKFGKQNI